jgi:hypothetical protein
VLVRWRARKRTSETASVSISHSAAPRTWMNARPCGFSSRDCYFATFGPRYFNSAVIHNHGSPSMAQFEIPILFCHFDSTFLRDFSLAYRPPINGTLALSTRY